MGISAGIPGRVGLIYFLKRKKSRLKSTNSQKIKTTLPIMVRYPFDVLRAVSQIEPLTMNGRKDALNLLRVHTEVSKGERR
jgi:hypothetical protein